MLGHTGCYDIQGISKINNERTGNIAIKLDKDINWQYAEKEFQQASKHRKIYLNSFVFTEMHIKTMKDRREETSLWIIWALKG